MTRLMLIADRPRIFGSIRTDGLSLVPAHDNREGTALIRLAGSGALTVDLALPGHAGYRCVAALAGSTREVPVLVIVGCDDSIRALRLIHMPGWPSTLGLPSRDFDRLMAVVRRQHNLQVRTVGFLVPGGAAPTDSWAYADEWHATQFAIARDVTSEHRAIA